MEEETRRHITVLISVNGRPPQVRRIPCDTLDDTECIGMAYWLGNYPNTKIIETALSGDLISMQVETTTTKAMLHVHGQQIRMHENTIECALNLLDTLYPDQDFRQDECGEEKVFKFIQIFEYTFWCPFTEEETHKILDAQGYDQHARATQEWPWIHWDSQGHMVARVRFESYPDYQYGKDLQLACDQKEYNKACIQFCHEQKIPLTQVYTEKQLDSDRMVVGFHRKEFQSMLVSPHVTWTADGFQPQWFRFFKHKQEKTRTALNRCNPGYTFFTHQDGSWYYIPKGHTNT